MNDQHEMDEPDVFDGPPAFAHPDHDVESRLVTATPRWPLTFVVQ